MMIHHKDFNRDTKNRQTKRFGLSILAFCLFIALLVACTGNTPDTTEACIDICVDDQFSEFYYANNLNVLFGEPYSGIVLLEPDTENERVAQYFNGGRLEANPETGAIEIAQLGEWAYEGLLDPIVAKIPIDGDTECFDNGWCVQGAFLDFYLENNGSLIFGQPLSPQLDEGDLRVQYFENVRLEWHPEAPAGQQVQVGLTGRAHYLYVVYEPILIALPIDTELESVNVTAAVRAPIMYRGDEQVIYVLVEKPDRTPVSGVKIELVITHNSETYTQPIDEETSGTGTVQAVVDLPNFTPEKDVQVQVLAYDKQGKELGNTIITFQAWW